MFLGCYSVVNNLPQLTGPTTVKDLVIAPGANLDLNGNTLQLDGAFKGGNNAYLKGSATSGLNYKWKCRFYIF
jgi:hypothetical protein